MEIELTTENEPMIVLNGWVEQYRELKADFHEALLSLISDMEYYGQDQWDGLKLEDLKAECSSYSLSD